MSIFLDEFLESLQTLAELSEKIALSRYVDCNLVLRYQFDTGMPRKLRQLIAELERAGFGNRGGKGSHRNYIHPNGIRITVSGNPGHDAKPYQEREVRMKIVAAQK